MTKGEKTLSGVVGVLTAILLFGGGFVVARWNTAPTATPSPSAQNTNQAATDAPVVFDQQVKTELTVPEGLEKAKVVKVIDGDTIEVEGNRTIRFIGINTPETHHPTKGVECFGKQASDATHALLDGQTVMLEKDISETDRYSRLLRYVYVEDMMVNEYLVLQGFAFSDSYPPDVKYQERLVVAQKEAFEKERGLWKACKVSGDHESILGYATDETQAASTKVQESSKLQTPQIQKNNQDPMINNPPSGTSQKITNNQSSNTQTPSSTQASVQVVTTSTKKEGCNIKGNISSGGKIYHLPGCGSYEKTGIDESQGEKWFCSEEEAVAAGWRKAKNC